MQTTAIGTVANSLPEKGVILLTLLISDRYILFAELLNNQHTGKMQGDKKRCSAQCFMFACAQSEMNVSTLPAR